MTIQEINEQILALDNLPNTDVFNVGYSLLGRPIIGVHIGSYDGTQILIQGAIHAREYITALLLIRQVEYLADKRFSGGFYFIPLMNPDGVDLVLQGTKNLPCHQLTDFLTMVNNGNKDFSLWKANANAVDLNVNFDADWGQGRQNVFCPSPANFVGYYPESEREVRALIDFAYRVKPSMTISYHSRGEVIYYGFEGQTDSELARDLKIASELAEVTGYVVERSYGSVGGFKDWTTRYLKVPAVTIEVGDATMQHPIGVEYLDVIYEKNKNVPLTAMQALEQVINQGKGNNLWKRNLFMRR